MHRLAELQINWKPAEILERGESPIQLHLPLGGEPTMIETEGRVIL